MADGDIKITVTARSLPELKKNLANVRKEFGRSANAARLLDTGVGSLGNRLGFVAFQMTFLAGVAGRALGEVTQRLNTLVQDGSKDLSTIGRAITRSGFDISASSGEARESVDLLNNAMRTFGSGRTIFNVQETAGAFDAVGRAVNFAGTELQRAKQQIIVASEVLKLMTIEEQNADSAAINFVKTMKLFSIGVEEASRVSDVLVAVNNQSTITLDGLVRSLGFAGQQARDFGLTFEETAATLGVIQDRLGVLNGGPGRNFSILLQNLSSSAVSLDADLAGIGVRLRDSSGQMRGITDIVGQFARALNSAGIEGSLARKQIIEMINATSRGERTLLALVQGYDELQESIENAEGAVGIADRMATAFEQLPEERITRLKNAFNSLRVELVGSMSPAVEELVEVMRELITDSNIQDFMQEVGTTLSQLVIPPLKSIVNVFKGFATILKQNTFILKTVVGGFAALLGILTSLFIIGTIGALIAIVASGVGKLATNTFILSIATNAALAPFLKLAVAFFGIFLILKGIDTFLGVVTDGITEAELPTLALAGAMTALGAAMLVLPFKIGGVGAAITKSGSLLTGFKVIAASVAASLFGLGNKITSGLGLGSKFPATLTGAVNSFKRFGENISRTLHNIIVRAQTGNLQQGMAQLGGRMGLNVDKGFGGAVKSVPARFGKLIGSLGKAGIVGAAIVAAAAIGLAIKNEIDGRVASSRLLAANDGFQTETEAWAFQFKAAIASTISEIGRFFQKIPEFVIAALEAAGKIIFKFGQDSRIVFDKLLQDGIPAAIEAAQQALDNLFSDNALEEVFDAIQGTFDARFLAAETITEAIKEGLASDDDLTEIARDIANILETSKQGGADQLGNAEELRKIIQETTNLDETLIEELITKVLSPFLNSDTAEFGATFQAMKKAEREAEILAQQEALVTQNLVTLGPQLKLLEDSIVDQTTGLKASGRQFNDASTAISLLAESLADGSITLEEFNFGLTQVEKEYIVYIDELDLAGVALSEMSDQTHLLIESEMTLDEKIKAAQEEAGYYVDAQQGLTESVTGMTSLFDETSGYMVDINGVLTDKTLPELIAQQNAINTFTNDTNIVDDTLMEVDDSLEEIVNSAEDLADNIDSVDVKGDFERAIEIMMEKGSAGFENAGLEGAAVINALHGGTIQDTEESNEEEEVSSTLKESMNQQAEVITKNIENVNTLNASQEILIEKVDQDAEVIQKLTISEESLIKADDENTQDTIRNSSELKKNSETLLLGTTVLNENIIQIVNIQNRMIDFILEIDKASIGFSLLARESAEVARRLSTVTMDSDGNFHISGRQTAGVDKGEVTQLGGGLEGLNQQFANDMRDLVKLNVDEIRTEQNLIATLNTLSQNIESLVPTATETSLTGFANGGIVGKPTRALLGEDGPEAIIPLDRLNQLQGGNNQTVTTNITVNVEGLADDTTADEIANIVADRINRQIKNKQVTLI
jgi:TP901 family phage tail tape measure protein